MSRVWISAIAFGFLLACTVTNTEGSAPSKGTDRANDTNTSQSDGGEPTGDAASSSKPRASETEITFDTDGTCNAFTACGGNPTGTYDYQSGCVANVFASIRQSCPGLDTSGVVIKGKGTVYLDGVTLTRVISSHATGTVVFPQACNPVGCTALANALRPGFESITCTGTTSCTCTISKRSVANDANTYTISGSTLTTGAGDRFEFCDKSGTIEYRGAGADADEGTWTLKKR
jgi:hypothetical protein